MRIFKSHPLLILVNFYIIDLPQPSNLSYLWNFGSLLAVYLIIQIIISVISAMHYNPSIGSIFKLKPGDGNITLPGSKPMPRPFPDLDLDNPELGWDIYIAYLLDYPWLLALLLAYLIYRRYRQMLFMDLSPVTLKSDNGTIYMGVVDCRDRSGFWLRLLFLYNRDLLCRSVVFDDEIYTGLFLPTPINVNELSNHYTLIPGMFFEGSPQISITFVSPSVLHWQMLIEVIDLTVVTGTGSDYLLEPSIFNRNITIRGSLNDIMPPHDSEL